MATTLHSSDITGVQKAAILLIALGPERSSKIFQHLKDDEIEALTLEIANTKSVSAELKDEVLDEFYEVCLAQQYIAEGGIAYAKELLDKALGEDRARDVIGRLTASLQSDLESSSSKASDPAPVPHTDDTDNPDALHIRCRSTRSLYRIPFLRLRIS